MVDYSVFDSILDSAFVIDGDGRVVYCNDAGAAFFQSSIRRLVNKAVLSDFVEIRENNIFPFTEASLGRREPTPFIETEFNLIKSDRKGKLQLAIRPLNGEHWLVFFRDVSLEEALYTKFRSELAQKEEYARNLEKLVEARTAELRSVNQSLNAILNSLGQGFFTFNKKGECGPIYTRACETILEKVPSGEPAWQILAIEEHHRPQFHQWTETLFNEVLPFDDLRALGPEIYPHSKGRHITLEFYPIRADGNSISEVVVVATDKTAEHEAQQKLEIERQFGAMILKYTKNKEQFLLFLASIRQTMVKLLSLAKHPLLSSELNESFRILHTLEGEAGAFSMRQLRLDARSCQECIEDYKSSEAIPGEVQQVYLQALLDMKGRYEEFLSANENIFSLSDLKKGRQVEVTYETLRGFYQELSDAGIDARLKSRYQDLFFKVSLQSRLTYFDGLIQNVAERLGKKVRPLLIEGGDLRIFPEPHEKIFATMVHAFRNAVDHGLEMPEEREWIGKDPAGQIKIKAEFFEQNLRLVISDDGRGIDPQAIRKNLSEKFPHRDFSDQTDEQIIQNVCLPGFSSKKNVGEFSGRGVGLDALREEVLRSGGSIFLKSVQNQGTSITIEIPMPGLELAVRRSA